MALPLQGIKVIELARTLAGPVTGQMLGDLGAEVIKVEKPGVGDESRHFTPPDWGGESCYYISSNRNKKSITLNLKTEKGKEILYNLVKESIILIENFRTGVSQKLGVDYETLREINDQLIYLSISGFGRTGPEKNRPGYDLSLQAYSGLMSTTGEPDMPYKAGPSVVDLSTGILGAVGVLSAILARGKTGTGQFIDCSLFDGQIMILNHLATSYFATGKSPGPMGQSHNSIVPYQVFDAKDKKIIIAVDNDILWMKMCKALKWDDLLENENFTTNKLRVLHRETLVLLLSKRIAKLSSAEILTTLEDVGVPCGPINTVGEAVSSPQAVAREAMVEMEHPILKKIKTPAFPLKFSQTSLPVRHHPPLLGEHTNEILSNIGYEALEIMQFADEEII